MSWLAKHTETGNLKTPYGDKYTGFKIKWRW